MPVLHSLTTLSNVTATRIVGADNMPHTVTLHNMTKSSNEYIHYGGDNTVGTANSPHIDPGETLTIDLGPNDEIWAISDPNGLEVGVLDVRKED